MPYQRTEERINTVKKNKIQIMLKKIYRKKSILYKKWLAYAYLQYNWNNIKDVIDHTIEK